MMKQVCVPVDVRFRDIDAMGHVNNAVYFTYFEEARKVFLSEAFKIQDPKDYFFILANIKCNYISPIEIKHLIDVIIYVGNVGNKSFTFKYKIVKRNDHSAIFAEGESTQVCYDYEQKRTIPIPEKVKNILYSYTLNQ